MRAGVAAPREPGKRIGRRGSRNPGVGDAGRRRRCPEGERADRERERTRQRSGDNAALDEAPPTATASTKAKKHTVVEGTDNAFKWARKYHVKLAWGTDLMFVPAQMKNQNTDILKLTAWMTPAEALKLVTHDNAELLALSGPRNPYPGKLGVIQEGALADVLLVDGDPIANLALVGDPGRNFVVIMKDGKIYKNTLQ